MENSKQQFVKRYTHLPDEQLIYEFGMIDHLTHDAAEAMREEVERRKLDVSMAPQHATEAEFVGGEMVAWSMYKKIVYWNAVIGACLLLIFIAATLLGF